MAKANAVQNARLIGKLEAITKTEVKTFDSGTEYLDYNARLRLSNGVVIFNRKRIFNPNAPTEHSVKTIDSLESMIATLEDATANGVVLFAEKRISPNKSKTDKDAKSNDFNYFTSYINKEDVLKFGTEGDILLVEEENIQELISQDADGEDVVVDYLLTFTRFDGTTYTQPFYGHGLEGEDLAKHKAKNNISVEYILSEVDEDTRLVTFEDLGEDYPKKVVAELDETYGIEGLKDKIGQGYKITLSFIKGQKIEAAPAEGHSWDDEVKATYSPDRLIWAPVGKIPGLSKSITGGTANKKAPKKPAGKVDF